jgi:hypothetical protein
MYGRVSSALRTETEETQVSTVSSVTFRSGNVLAHHTTYFAFQSIVIW